MKTLFCLLLSCLLCHQSNAQLDAPALLKKHNIKAVVEVEEIGTTYYVVDEHGYIVKAASGNPSGDLKYSSQVYYNNAQKPDSIITTGLYKNCSSYFFYKKDGSYTQADEIENATDSTWFDKTGKKIKKKDGYGRITKYGYNTKQQLIKETTTAFDGNSTVTYTYNSSGQVVSRTRKTKDATYVSKYEYNEKGLLSKEVFDGMTTLYKYISR
jgi:YD repeat-containing protein